MDGLKVIIGFIAAITLTCCIVAYVIGAFNGMSNLTMPAFFIGLGCIIILIACFGEEGHK